MFHQISWSSYWTSIALAYSFYYFSVSMLFYRGALLRKASSFIRTRRLRHSSFWMRHISSEKKVTSTESGESGEIIIESCLDELNAFFESAKKSKSTKDTLVSALSAICNKYSSPDLLQHKHALNNILVVQAENVCSVHLNEGDLDKVWKKSERLPRPLPVRRGTEGQID